VPFLVKLEELSYVVLQRYYAALSDESLQRAFPPYVLKNGILKNVSTHYIVRAVRSLEEQKLLIQTHPNGSWSDDADRPYEITTRGIEAMEEDLEDSDSIAFRLFQDESFDITSTSLFDLPP
jgi:hypothetical protein